MFKAVSAVLGLAIAGTLLFQFNIIKLPGQNRPAAKEKVSRRIETGNESYRQAIAAAAAALSRGNALAALNAYAQASQEAPTNPDPYERIADIYFAQKQYESARQNYEFSQSLRPASSTIRIKIVRTLLGMRLITEARAQLDLMPADSQPAAYYKGLVAAAFSDHETAKDLLRKSISMSADLNMKAFAEQMLSAYRDFEIAREAPQEFLLALLAGTFNRAGEHGLAIETAFNAIKLKHDYRDAWLILGHSFLNENKFADAEDSFTKSIELDSTVPAAFFFRGAARSRANNHTAAISDFEHAITIGSQPKIIAQFELAQSFFALNDFERAYPLYRETALTDPSDLNRFIRPMALAINHIKKPADALELANAAWNAHPNTAEAYNLLGWAALANNDLSASRKNLQEAIKLKPDFDAAFLNLGTLEERDLNMEDAKRYYEKAYELALLYGNESIAETARLRAAILQGTAADESQIFPAPEQTPKSNFIPSLNLL